MLQTAAKWGRILALTAAVASPAVSYLAWAGGWGVAALPLAALQAVAAGIVLWDALPTGRVRGLAVLTPLCMLAALGAGAWRSAAAGLMVAAGLWHATLYSGLLMLFAATLGRGRTPLVTRLARSINPAFHSGMEGYTRAVTVAWCVFFAVQVVLSATLLGLAPDAWRLFVTVLNLPSVVLMAVAEYAVRCWRFRNEAHTTLLATIRGVLASRRGPRGAPVP